MITSVNLDSRGNITDGQKLTRTNRNTDRKIYKLDWTPLGSLGPQCGDKLIYMAIKYFQGNRNKIDVLLVKMVSMHTKDGVSI